MDTLPLVSVPGNIVFLFKIIKKIVIFLQNSNFRIQIMLRNFWKF